MHKQLRLLAYTRPNYTDEKLVENVEVLFCFRRNNIACFTVIARTNIVGIHYLISYELQPP